MRPTSIVLFERLFLLSLAIALVNGFLRMTRSSHRSETIPHWRSWAGVAARF